MPARRLRFRAGTRENDGRAWGAVSRPRGRAIGRRRVGRLAFSAASLHHVPHPTSRRRENGGPSPTGSRRWAIGCGASAHLTPRHRPSGARCGSVRAARRGVPSSVTMPRHLASLRVAPSLTRLAPAPAGPVRRRPRGRRRPGERRVGCRGAGASATVGRAAPSSGRASASKGGAMYLDGRAQMPRMRAMRRRGGDVVGRRLGGGAARCAASAPCGGEPMTRRGPRVRARTATAAAPPPRGVSAGAGPPVQAASTRAPWRTRA